jgi:hypothetical protein
VRGLLSFWETPWLWVLFFLTSVYGHVAVKLAVPGPAASDRQVLARAAGSFWG